MAKINCLRFKNQFLNKCRGFPNFPFHIELSTNFFSEKLYVRNQQHIEYDISMHTRIVTHEGPMAFLRVPLNECRAKIYHIFWTDSIVLDLPRYVNSFPKLFVDLDI